jgi:hypothetical protein
VNLTSRVSFPPAEPRPAPAALLGPGHPFVRDSERLASVVRAFVVGSAVLLGATTAVAAGASSARAMIVAVAVADLLFVCWAALLLDRRRWHALDLVGQGREALPIPAVARLVARLNSPRHRRRLIRSVEELVDPEVRPFDVATVPWRFVRSDLLAPVHRELNQIARLLRNSDASVQGVALMTQLMHDGTSSLHGFDIRVLREELARVRFLLEPRPPGQ